MVQGEKRVVPTDYGDIGAMHMSIAYEDLYTDPPVSVARVCLPSA